MKHRRRDPLGRNFRDELNSRFQIEVPDVLKSKNKKTRAEKMATFQKRAQVLNAKSWIWKLSNKRFGSKLKGLICPPELLKDRQAAIRYVFIHVFEAPEEETWRETKLIGQILQM